MRRALALLLIATFLAPAAQARDASRLEMLRAAATPSVSEEVRALAEFAVEGGFKQGRWALLVTDPKATAFSMLYRQGVGEHYPVQVFSSVDGASAYLGQNLAALLG